MLRQSFRSYGELFGKTGNHKESLDYIGERTDSETGLTYLHARYYDSALGIFLSPDPIGADSNTYRYSFGDSVNFRDPSGLCGESYSGFSTNIHGVVTQTQPSSGVDCDWSDEGEIARSRAAFQNYLNDHNYPAPLRGRLGCVANPDQERCRPDPDDPCAIDQSAEGCGPGGPAGCENGLAAGGETCGPKPPPGCDPLMSCPNAPNATPEERQQLQMAHEALLAAIRDVPGCSALFGSSFAASDYLDQIAYTFLAGGSNTSGAEHTPGRVGLYRPPGLFFQGGGGYWRRTWGDNSPRLLLGSAWQASIVGHELAHEMGAIEHDSFNAFGIFSPHMSLANAYLIANRCFGYGG